MEIFKLDFQKVDQFSAKDKAFKNQDKNYVGHLPYPSSLEGIYESSRHRQNHPLDRKFLVNEITRQYEGIGLEKTQLSNTENLLSELCFTITTAHQPVVFLGPMYVIYKALHVIKLAKLASAKNDKFKYVPIYVIGGEDHDFEEIKSSFIFGSQYDWDINSNGQSVGGLNPDKLAKLAESLLPRFENDVFGKDWIHSLIKAYQNEKSFVRATQVLLNKLFAQFGLLVIDLSTKPFKAQFKSFIKEEILKQPSQSLVIKTQAELEAKGFKSQAFARPINFFYQSNLGRKRIEFNSDLNQFRVLDTSLSFTSAEMFKEIEENPENFSPNVIMRPIYQSFTLPDVAYVGGGGEIAYWVERTSQFAHFNVHFPVLLRRASCILLRDKDLKQFQKLGFELMDIIKSEQELIKSYLLKNEEIRTKSHIEEITQSFQGLINMVKEIDASLEGKVNGQLQKNINFINDLEKRLLKSSKSKNAIVEKKIKKIKSFVFPEGQLQERKENLLNYTAFSQNIIQDIYELIDIETQDLHILKF